jgi:hypothetical protein
MRKKKPIQCIYPIRANSFVSIIMYLTCTIIVLLKKYKNHKVQDQVGQIYTVINNIKIKELASQFARCGLTDRSVAIQILTLLMWQNFNTKRGTQQQKPVGINKNEMTNFYRSTSFRFSLYLDISRSFK